MPNGNGTVASLSVRCDGYLRRRRRQSRRPHGRSRAFSQCLCVLRGRPLRLLQSRMHRCHRENRRLRRGCVGHRLHRYRQPPVLPSVPCLLHPNWSPCLSSKFPPWGIVGRHGWSDPTASDIVPSCGCCWAIDRAATGGADFLDSPGRSNKTSYRHVPSSDFHSTLEWPIFNRFNRKFS